VWDMLRICRFGIFPLLVTIVFANTHPVADDAHDATTTVPLTVACTDEVTAHGNTVACTESEAEGHHDAAAGSAAAGSAAAGEHGEHGHETTPVCITIATMLFGSIAFLMGVTYVLNCYWPRVREHAWGFISATLSIFCAVMAFSVCKHTSTAIFGESPAPLLVGVLSLQFVFYGLRNRPGALKAFGVVSGHFAGFCAIENFEHFFEEHQKEGLWVSVLIFVLVFLMLVAMVFVAHMLRKHILHKDLSFRDLVRQTAKDENKQSSSDEEAEEVSKLNGKGSAQVLQMDQRSKDALWEEVCEEVEMDALALCLGLVVSQMVRRVVAGVFTGNWELPHLHGSDGEGKGSDEIVCVGVTGFVFFLLALALRSVIGKMKSCVRAMRMFEDILAMSSAWCTIFFSMWLYFSVYHPTSKMQMKSSLAVGVTVECFAILLIIVGVARMFERREEESQGMLEGSSEEESADEMKYARQITGSQVTKGTSINIKTIIKALGLVVGLSWEKAFDLAAELIAENENFEESSVTGKLIMLDLVILVIVAPAWGLYILPQAQKLKNSSPNHGELHDPHGIFACCE